jgi:glycosyltransferase involved in cell wall biosynthesis
MKPLNIAMIGTKGIPAQWGGIEKYIEETGKRLVQMGYAVTVYGSKWFCEGTTSHLGMRVRNVPSIKLKATDALTNAFFASILAIHDKCDIVHFHGYASYYFVPLFKTFGIPTIITAHGVESGWDNPKYNDLGRLIIKNAFTIGIKNADVVTSVAGHLSSKIKQLYNVDSRVMPSGIDDVEMQSPDLINKKYGLSGMDYVLFLGRIDPIKRVHWLLELDSVLNRDIKIVISGGAQDSSTEQYLKDIKRKASSSNRILFTGPVSGKIKAELLSNCLLYCAPSENEGLPISVLEAMSYGRCCVASDIPAHMEILKNRETGFLYSSTSKEKLCLAIKEIVSLPKRELEEVGRKAFESLTTNFNWNNTAQKLGCIYKELGYVKRCKNGTNTAGS